VASLKSIIAWTRDDQSQKLCRVSDSIGVVCGRPQLDVGGGRGGSARRCG
jgi:hypothetical protein